MQPLTAALVGAALGVVGVRLSLRWSARSPPFTRAPRPGFEPGFEPGFDSNRPGYIHTGSGILVVNNVTTGAKYKQITDKLRSSDSRPAPLRLIRSVMDLYLFLRAFIFCRHYTNVR